jgi:hypothetical protein
MAESTRERIAQTVRRYLANVRPGGVTLEVVDTDIRQVDHWWRVPIRPSVWPARMFEYYEALAEVESEIQEKEHLNILLSTGEPQTAESAKAA